MSYPKKPVATKTKPTAGPQPKANDPKREKLLAIQEREQLKGLLVNKFLEKYSKGTKISQDYVNKQVTEFMKNEKVTEDNLKKLEQKIREGLEPKKKAPSDIGDDTPKNQQKPPSVKDKKEEEDPHAHLHHYDEIHSVASSEKPRSVYAQGDSDDEWATMMKYDTELYKKEKALEKVREQEQKKKMKDELDRQIAEKKRLKESEQGENKRYVELVHHQINQYDKKEHKKETEMHNKIMQEKYSRDRQLQEENLRKKIEKKTEREMDELLVKQIKQEIESESRTAAVKRYEDKENLKQVLIENEENKVKMAEEARREKQADVRAQQEYTRLIEKQEAERDAELKAREDRAKKFMNMMADTVVKDQKEQILEEERKLLKHYLDKEQREIEDDKRRQQRLNDQKKEMRKFLDQQVADKERKKQEEALLEKKQADIWKKDTEDFTEHEKKKTEYIKDVNKKHAEYLEKQMEGEQKRQKKMNTQELLLNKPKLKEIAVKTDDPQFKKQLVNPHQH